MDLNIILEGFFKLLGSSESAMIVSVITNIFTFNVVYLLMIIIINEKMHHLRVEKSMQEVEQCRIVMQKKFESHYLAFAKDFLGEDYFNHIENYLYTYLIKEPLRDIRRQFRRRIRKNGFENKTPLQWKEYVKDCLEEDESVFTDGLNRVYYRLADVPRVGLYEHNQELRTELSCKYGEMMQQILAIANDYPYKKFYKWEIKFQF